jgi:two-component system chemotaxis sensor kinase CheA
MEDQDIVREFLLESNENLTRLDQQIVELERRPQDADLLASVFRTIHTIKGTCGFLGFTLLEGVAHEAENILSQLRSGQREISAPLVSLILEAVDATKAILRNIEETGAEGPDNYAGLRERLATAAKLPPAEVAAARAAAPPDTPPAAGVAESEKSLSVTDTAIRVDVGLLDKLMNLVGELVLARNQILQFNSQREDVALNATSQRLNLITTELQEGVMKTRMQPIGLVWNKLPRLVRDVSHALGKQVQLEMDGADTELDKTIIEAIKDPLTHLVRNACDHGIETPEERVRRGKPAQGTLQLRAYHEGGQVNIEISDNGAGIDVERVKQKAVEKGLCSAERASRMSEREALNLIFMPGFSTAQQVTNVSGRGVGMDVVKSNIEKIGGAVDVATKLGEWTTVKLKIPLTLAIIPGLVVTSAQERFVIPQVSLLELIRLEAAGAAHIEHVHGTPVYRRRGSLLPIAYLSDILGLPRQATETVNIVVLQAEDRQFGLVVDSVNDTQEIVVKPLGKQLKGLSIYAGATIMGDGRVALILDVLGIGRHSGVLAHQRETERAGPPKPAQAVEDRQRLLLFQTASFERLALPLSLVSRLEEFPQSAIERSGDHPVVQYRGGILPLIRLDAVLAPGRHDTALEQDPAQVIVIQDGERMVGLAVERVLDIVEEAVTVRRPSQRPGLLGAAVVGRQVTDFVDLQAVLRAGFGEWFEQPASGRQRRSLLLAEGSPFVRGLLRAELEMAGYAVREASAAAEAVQALDGGGVDVVVTAADLPGAEQFAKAVRSRPGLANIPLLALAGEGHTGPPEGFDDFQKKFDRAAMLHSIERLAAAVAGPAAPAASAQ